MALFTSRTLPAIWAFFVITYIHSASSTPDLQNIRTFHVFQDLVAVGIEDYITIHRFDDLMNDISKAERKVSLKRTFNGSDVSVEILHLRLLNSTNLSYCDPFACWFCYVDSKESKCNGYFINSPGQRQRQMKVVQCVTNHVHMTVRFLDEGHNASIVRFNLAPISNEQIPIYPLNEAMDAEGSSIFEQNLVDGFQFNGFTYFFGSALRIDPLECKKNDRPSECYDPKNLKENVRVTRICDKDETKHLESRIDISLSCEPSHFNSALAAYFEESQGVVSIAFGLRNFTQISICTFNISDIEKQFEFTWSTCQKVTDDKQCKKKNTAAYPECKISSREFDNKGYRVCKKYFYKSPKYLPSEHIDICSLGNYNETTYRYGWLENFAALPGKHKLSVVLNSSDVTEGFLTAHSASGSWFLISKGKGRLPRLDRFVSSANYSIWNVNGVDAIPIIHSSATNRLFYARANSVQMQDIACESLYKNCNEVPDLSAKDPLECGWCVVKNKAGTSVSAGDKHSCNGQITFDGCPPAIDRTVKEKDGNLTIYGSNFNKLSDMSITACGKPCSLLEHRESKLICKMEQLADYCAVNVSGKLPHTNAFHANYEGESSTSSSTSVSKKDTTTLKAVISVVSIIIIMLLIGLIVYLMRRYQQKKKRKSRNPSNSGQHMIPPMPASNDYKPFPGGYNGNADPYEAIFGSFAGHRIKINNLQYEHKPVGQGFFGSVFRGTYVLNGKSLDVACKALKTDRINSTADFLREAEVMAQLSHHRVLPFVGLFYDLSNRKYPTLLVTQFMPNGDLFHYIQDEHRIITLNELLNFCLQAAEGMEYLHTQGWIHRDLAARNCMLDARLNLYLADFGLTRKFEVEETGSYYTALSTRELPITSLSLEAFSGKFSTKSDVWAFGNMMWEVVTRGWIPWERLSKTELVERLRNGDRLAKPEHCPPEIYRNIMLPCWAENKDMRPSFSEIIEVTETTIIDLRKREESRMNSNYERVAPRHA